MALVKNGSLATADVKDGTLTVAGFLAGQVPSGPAGPKGDQGPSGVVAGTTTTGGGPTPTSTTQFFGVPAPATVAHPSQPVLVVANNSFGTYSSSATSLNLFICYPASRVVR